MSESTEVLVTETLEVRVTAVERLEIAVPGPPGPPGGGPGATQDLESVLEQGNMATDPSSGYVIVSPGNVEVGDEAGGYTSFTPGYIGVSDGTEGAELTANGITLQNAAGTHQLAPATLTAPRSWTLPNASGTFALLSDIPEVEALFPDPGADRLVMWDESANEWAPVTLGAGLAITGTELRAIAATDIASGISERAILAEAQAGVDTTRFITPFHLKTVLDAAIAANPGPAGPAGAAGSPGATGSTGSAGANGREVQLQKSSTHIQWRYAGDVSWINLVALADITGPQGVAGSTGATGATGSAGAQGIQGIQGVPGSVGATGSAGAPGSTGAAGPGVAAGGTTGQYLRKSSGTDYATGWDTLDVADVSGLDTRLGGLTFVKLTQAAYTALGTKDSNTLYLIVG